MGSKSPAIILCTIVTIFLRLESAFGGDIYTTYPGYMLNSPCIAVKSSAGPLSGCVAMCSQLSTCVSGSYNLNSHECCMSQRLIYHDGVDFVEDEQSVYFQIKADVVWHDSWALVFRASQGINVSAYTNFLDVSHHDDRPVGGATASIACWSLSGTHSCSTHLGSSLLRSWNNGSLGVKKVKYSFYKDGKEAKNIVFNGTGSNLTSWFVKSRVLSSTYSDVTNVQTYNYFGVYGFMDALAERRFYVSKDHSGCDNDKGWMAVVEKPYCSWETLGTAPHFVFSSTASCAQWHVGSVGRADVMAIFVQF